MPHLGSLTPELKTLLADLRLQGLSYRQITTALEERGVAVTSQTVGNWFRSQEGKAAVSAQQQLCQEEWGKQPLAERMSRVNALVEVAVRLQHALSETTVGAPEFYELSDEFRKYLLQINKEMEPVVLTVRNQEASPYDDFIETLKSRLTPEALGVIGIADGSTH